MMEKIIAILVLLLVPMPVTDSRQADYPPDPQYDATEFQIGTTFDLIRSFDKQTIRKTFDEWISQHQTIDTYSKIINSFNITFIKFIPDEEIVPISKLSSISVAFNTFLSQWKFNSIACQQMVEEQGVSTYHKHVMKAMESVWIKRIEFLKKSVFQSICDKSLYLDNNSYINNRKHYFRFKYDCYKFPFSWMCDHQEIIINGLHKFRYLTISYNSDEEINFKMETTIDVLWNIASLLMIQFRFNINSVSIEGVIRNRKMDDIKVTMLIIAKVGENDDVLVPLAYSSVITETLEKLTEYGIKRTIQEIRYNGNGGFANAMREILRPFDVKMFGNLFEIQTQEKFSFVPTVFSNFEIEVFHLNNITWSQFDNVEIGIGTLRCKGIRAQADFSYPIRNNDVLSVPVSAKVHIKETAIHISLQYYFNSTHQEVEMRIDDDDLSDADTTIEITSSHYRLPQKERTAIGKRVFQNFVQMMKNQIIDVTKSTFRSVFDVCKNSSSASIPVQLDRSYFAVIRDSWSNTTTKLGSTQPVEIMIEGYWNFQSINVQYANGKLSIAGIQLQNVTAIILFKFEDSNETITTNLTMRYFSLIISHTYKEVLVSIPPYSEYTWTISPNISLPVRDAGDMMEKFESAVELFISHSIYEKDPNYREKFRKLAIHNMMQAIHKDDPTTHHESSKFATDFAQALNSKEFTRFHLGAEAQVEFSLDTHRYTWKQTALRKKSLNSTSFPGNVEETHGKIADPIVEEETCFHSGNSQDVFRGKQENLVSAFEEGNTTLKTKLAQLTNSFLHRNLKTILSNYNFCTSAFVEKYFLAVTNTNNIDDSRHFFPMYHIKLYGLHNFESLRIDFSLPARSFATTEFKMKMTNLTARIIWYYYIDEAIARIPKVVNLDIKYIQLCGKIVPLTERLLFNDKSEVRFLNQNISMVVEKFDSSIESIVLNAIQDTILEEYNKIRQRYRNNADKSDFST